MIKLFTLRQPIVFLLLVFLVLLMKLPSLLFVNLTVVDITSYTFFGDFFIFLNRTKMSTYIVGILIILLQTLHLNYIFEKHGVHYKSTFLPALFYIIYASLLNGVDSKITPSLLAQTPLMIVLGIYFDLYKSNRIRQKIFRAMLVLGFGMLVYLPLAYFVLVFWICIFFVKIPSVRDYAIATMGAVLPVYFTFVYFYYNNQYLYFIEKIKLLTLFKWTVTFEETKVELVLLCVLGVIIILTSVKLYMNHFKNIIKTRIIQQMLFVLSFVSLVVLTFLLQFRYEHLLLFIIPFSYLLSYFFMGKWRFLLNEIIAIALFIFIIIIKSYNL